ncbi:hypothetical protein K2173_007230 [Erythroxylum novogranatense]|uniref:Zinc knuckle CX2CX4HX4C domain-containing protein n=1 Tax=Erythroxylum novogranatense TaxID=1862640 RepID=A0AAV8U8N7_9ROSI|nr:hypothetical protein K2173_007230 [Erythroxylum novogranatense]
MTGAKVLDVGNGYLMVDFALESAYLGALLEGSWTIMGSYLQVQPWHSKFRVSQCTPRMAVVWIRLPEMPLQYYPEDIIRPLGEAVGKVIRVDYNTSELQRGRFAQLAIIVDLDKPLVPKFYIDGEEFSVEYENLDNICFECGRYGHSDSFCSWKPKEDGTNNIEKEGELPITRASNDFGPWMIVKKIKRQPRRQYDNGNSKSTNTNQFNALQFDQEDDDRAAGGDQGQGLATVTSAQGAGREKTRSSGQYKGKHKDGQNRAVTRAESSKDSKQQHATFGEFFAYQ